MESKFKSKCGICEETFNGIDDLDKHISLKHVSLKYFPCKVCGMLFNNSINLGKHMMQRHPKQHNQEMGLIDRETQKKNTSD